jgi:hypothetical protein
MECSHLRVEHIAFKRPHFERPMKSHPQRSMMKFKESPFAYAKIPSFNSTFNLPKHIYIKSHTQRGIIMFSKIFKHADSATTSHAPEGMSATKSGASSAMQGPDGVPEKRKKPHLTWHEKKTEKSILKKVQRPESISIGGIQTIINGIEKKPYTGQLEMLQGIRSKVSEEVGMTIDSRISYIEQLQKREQAEASRIPASAEAAALQWRWITQKHIHENKTDQNKKPSP